jgi:hypothetical protein
MISESFNKGWTVGTNTGFFNITASEKPKLVTLPHDAVINQERKRKKYLRRNN